MPPEERVIPRMPRDPEEIRERQLKERKKELDIALNDAYGFSSRTPFKQRVETLYEDIGLKREEIADTLGEPLERVEGICDEIDAEIAKASRELTDEERAVEKGRHIRRLEKNVKALQTAFRNNGDEKLAAHITRITDKLADLQGIEKKKQAGEEGPGFANVLETKIATLDPEKIAKLRKALEQL